jgi:hypothetical protein
MSRYLRFIEWKDRKLMKICLLYKFTFLAKIAHCCFLLVDWIALFACIFIEARTYVHQRTNELKGFRVVKIDNCSFIRLEYEVMLFNGLPELVPSLVKGNQPYMLLSLFLNDSNYLFNNIILCIAQISFFFLYRMKISWLFDTKTTSLFWLSVSLIKPRRWMEECSSSHTYSLLNRLRSEKWMQSLVVYFQSTLCDATPLI